MAPETVRREGIFYGWFVLAAGFFVLFLATGSRGGFGVFVIPLTEEFGWTREAISRAIAIGWLVNGLTQPFLGRLYDRFGGRMVISASLLVLGSSTVLLSLINSLWLLVVIYGIIMSVAAGGASLVTIHALLSKWFYARRGLALSISTTGASAGSLVMAPFATYIIVWAGWRVSWTVMGGLILVLAIPIAWFLIRDDPADVGESPDGENEQPTLGRSSRHSSMRRSPLEVDNWRDSYKSAPMWQMTGAYFVCGMTTAMISVHYVPFAIERGISSVEAAWAFGMMMGLNVLGVLGVGAISDRFGRKNLLGVVYAGRGMAYAMLVLAPSRIGIWGFAVIAGFSWIAAAPLVSTLTADIYGIKRIGTLNGMTTLSHQAGGALSIYMGGVLHTIFGTYTLAFAIAGSLLVAASFLSFSIGEKKYSARYQPVSAGLVPAAAGDSD